MEFEPTWRRNISDICRDFYSLSKEYQQKSLSYDSVSGFVPSIDFPIEYTEDGEDGEEIIIIDDIPASVMSINILTVDDAINEHKSLNGNKQLAWQSFKYHSPANLEAKYWIGYYYYH